MYFGNFGNLAEGIQGAIVQIQEQYGNSCCGYRSSFPEQYPVTLQNHGISEKFFKEIIVKVNKRWEEIVNKPDQILHIVGRIILSLGVLTFLSNFILIAVISSTLIFAILPVTGIFLIIVGSGMISAASARTYNQKSKAQNIIQREIFDPLNIEGNLIWTIETTLPAITYRRRNGRRATIRNVYVITIKTKTANVGGINNGPTATFNPGLNFQNISAMATSGETFPNGYTNTAFGPTSQNVYPTAATAPPYGDDIPVAEPVGDATTGVEASNEVVIDVTDKDTTNAGSNVGSSSAGSVTDQLFKLNELLKSGGITRAEYDSLKAQLLSIDKA